MPILFSFVPLEMELASEVMVLGISVRQGGVDDGSSLRKKIILNFPLSEPNSLSAGEVSSRLFHDCLTPDILTGFGFECIQLFSL